MDEVIELYWALNEHASALQANQHVTRRKCKFVAFCGKVLAGVNKCKVRQYGLLSITHAGDACNKDDGYRRASM